MAVNNWRRMPMSTATILENPATMIQIKKTNDYNQKIKNAEDSSLNINNKIFEDGYSMMITTPGGNVLTWVFMNDPDRNKRYFEFTDLKRWGWTIKAPYNEDNLKAFKELSNKQATWKYWREWFDILDSAPQIKLYDWDKQITIDQYIDNKNSELQKKFDKYLRVFKVYQTANPETKKIVAPLMQKALKNYRDLKNNLYK